MEKPVILAYSLPEAAAAGPVTDRAIAGEPLKRSSETPRIQSADVPVVRAMRTIPSAEGRDSPLSQRVNWLVEIPQRSAKEFADEPPSRSLSRADTTAMSASFFIFGPFVF